MSTAVQRRRGTTAQHASFAGLNGELTVDTDKEVVVVHDGATAGGYPMMRENGSNSALALGSAGSPSLKWDANTGLYSPGADQVAISTNGQGRLFIGTTGAVGINNSSPSVLFHVTGTTGYVLAADGTTSGTTLGVFSDASYTKLIAVNNARSSFAPLVLDGSDTRFLVSGTERLRITSTGALNFVGAGTAGVTQAVSFNGSAPANSLVIDSSGRLGVGTSSPSYPLHVRVDQTATTSVSVQNASAGSGAYTQFRVDGDSGAGYFGYAGSGSGGTGCYEADYVYLASESSASGLNLGATSGPMRFYTGGITAANERLRITSAGLVGIGTTSPGSALQVNGAGGIRVNEDGAGTNQIQLRSDWAGQGPAINVQTNQSLIFTTNATERVRIDTSGRLGIGTGVGSSTYPVSIIHANTTEPVITASQSNTVIASGDLLGAFNAYSNDTSVTSRGGVGGIRVIAEGTYNTGNTPSRLAFYTHPTAANNDTLFGAVQECARFDSFGGFYVKGAGTAGVNYAFGINGVAPANSLQIDSSGRLLVGTSTSVESNALLQVVKASGTNVIQASSSLGNGESCRVGTLANSRAGVIGVYKHSGITNPCGYLFLSEEDAADAYYWTDNSGNFRVSNDGNNIGTTNGTVVGTQTSDERIKNILGPVEYALETIKQIEPVRYSLKSEPDVEKLGFVAQQVLPLIPQSVFDTKERIEGEPEDAPTKLGMEYVALIPVLVNAIKELSAEVDALKAQ